MTESLKSAVRYSIALGPGLFIYHYIQMNSMSNKIIFAVLHYRAVAIIRKTCMHGHFGDIDL